MEKFIIDTDPGDDDAQAIFIALKHFEVLAITTVGGNSTLDCISTNAARILEVTNKSVPIYLGSATPLIRDLQTPSLFHGKDGFGDFYPAEWKGKQECIKTDMKAAEAIVKIVTDNPGEVSLLCIAPLTNIALALKLDPTIATKLKRVFIMGGTLNGKGNSGGGGKEFNFKTDPEAAYIVFKNIPFIHLIPWEAAKDLVLTDEDYEKLYDESYPLTLFTKNICLDKAKKGFKSLFCDGLAAVAAVKLSAAEYQVDLMGDIIIDGPYAGSVMYNWPIYCRVFDPKKINVKVLCNFNHDESVGIWLDALRNP